MIKRRTLSFIALLLFLGLLLDLKLPIKHDFKQFNPVQVGTLDAAMWRSYYEHKPIKLFFQLSSLMRNQFHAPYMRSFLLAYYSARAAFIFKEGHNRKDYQRALPHLYKYFNTLNALAKDTFDINKLSRLELEWWIIRREDYTHTPEDWKILLGLQGEVMHHIPASRFGTYADQRVRAMSLRDSKGTTITEEDWEEIQKLCVEAWTSLYNVLH